MYLCAIPQKYPLLLCDLAHHATDLVPGVAGGAAALAGHVVTLRPVVAVAPPAAVDVEGAGRAGVGAHLALSQAVRHTRTHKCYRNTVGNKL